MKKRWVLAVIAVTLLWGCTMKGPPPQHRAVVRKICIERPGAQVSCSDPQTMRQILNALRQPGQLILPKEDPETLPLPELRLTLLLTDGTSRRYTFKGDRYLKKDDGPWKEAVSDHLTTLLTLLTDLAPPTHALRAVTPTIKDQPI